LVRTPQEIFERYCSIHIGHNTHLPVVCIKPIPPDDRCPFLRGNKCAVHAKKPVLCRVSPLARITKAEGGTEYYNNGAGCAHKPQTVTVREHIADVASEEAVQAGRVWTDLLVALLPLIPETFSTEDVRQQFYNVLFGALYLAYDMDKPFVPQLQENGEKLKIICGFKEDAADE
jgi:hypothetical protein